MNSTPLLQHNFLFVGRQQLTSIPAQHDGTTQKPKHADEGKTSTPPSILSPFRKLIPKEAFLELHQEYIRFRTIGKVDQQNGSSAHKSLLAQPLFRDQVVDLPLSSLVGAKLDPEHANEIILYTVQSPTQSESDKDKNESRFAHLPMPKSTFKLFRWIIRILDSKQEEQDALLLWHKILTYNIVVGFDTLLENYDAWKKENPASNDESNKQEDSNDESITHTSSLQTYLQEHVRLPEKTRKLFIVINPKSGKKLAKKYFALHVKPILDVAPLKYNVLLTERAQHATEACAEMDMREYDGIVTVGGDGVIFECLQGMMRNPTRNGTLLPIGVIGAGSSNGLATDLGAGHPIAAAKVIARGRVKHVDMLSFWQNDQVFYSFLSVTYALIADADIGTEWMRAIGSMRNIIGAVHSILRRKMYDGELHFISVPQDEKRDLKDDRRAKHTVFSSEFDIKQVKSADVRSDETSPITAAPADMLVPSLLLHYFPEEFQRLCPSSYKHYVANSNAVEEKPEDNAEKESPSATESKSSQSEDAQVTELSHETPFYQDQLWKQELQKKIPKDHIQVFYEKYLYFLACNVPHIAHDVCGSPHCELDNGQVDLIRMTKKLSRTKLLGILGKMEDGSFLDGKGGSMIQHDQCVAFFFKPLKKGSFVVLDGERMEYCPLLVEVHRRVLPLMVDERFHFTEHIRR